MLIWNDVTHISYKYILRIWRGDVRRAHTRVTANYDGLIITPAQLRYEEMLKGFAQVTDLAADNEIRSRMIMDWLIKCQCEDLLMLKSGSKSNSISHRTTHETNECTNLSKTMSESVLDPKLTRWKGAPKKMLRKSPLEMASKKANICSFEHN